MGPGALDQDRHEVVALVGSGLLERGKLRLDVGALAARADAVQPLDLLALQRGIDVQDRRLTVIPFGERVDADDNPPAGVDLTLKCVAGVRDLALG